MQRSKTIAVGLLFLVGLAIAFAVSRQAPAPSPKRPTASANPRASASAPPLASSSASPALDAAELPPPEELAASEGFDVLFDGRKAPPLPESAPQSATFGVVVFTYAGAELAPTGARTKEQARDKARAAIEEAKRDFSAAVAHGDRGSTANAGRVPRGVLESAAEYVLFTLEKGAVAPEPVDTPRGYWVVRRIN